MNLPHRVKDRKSALGEISLGKNLRNKKVLTYGRKNGKCKLKVESRS